MTLERVRLTAIRLAIVGVVLGAWELVGRFWVDPFWTSMPSRVAQRLVDWSQDGTLGPAIQTTATEILLGLAVGISAGGLIAIALGQSKMLSTVVRPYVIVMYAIPQLALAPLYILWFGLFLTPKVVLVAVMSAFFTFFNVYEGVRSTEDRIVAEMRLLGASRLQVLRWVVLPSAAVFIIASLRQTIPNGIQAAIVGEFIVSVQGLGYLAHQASVVLDLTGIFAAVVVVAAIGLVLDLLVSVGERVWLRGRADLVRTAALPA
jgi:NitT/TauT family transport system permease protein